ncbi:MAG: S41 family peptidase, partial [Planctomycetota bacterium]
MTTAVGYYRHPTIHGDRVVFVCEDDLWTVSASGGTARRLTANPGRIAFPSLSPDGRHIAFTGQDEGPPEVYVMDADGGAPERLTWMGCTGQVVGWRAHGKAVLFASDWRQPFVRVQHLHEVPRDGGLTKPLRLGPARAISFERGGKGVVLGRNSGDPARWKRYRGGTAGTLWVDRTGRGEFKPLVRLDGNLANPMWIGSRIYFLSDHEGHGNLYSCTPTGRSLRRHTHHEDFYVRYPSTDGKRIVYHAGADLYLFDPATNIAGRIPVSVHSSRPQRNRKFVAVSRYLESLDLHPEAHSVAAVARGGVFTMGLWEGAPERRGTPSKERYRLARWPGDGKHVVCVSDRKGEEGLVVFPTGSGGRGRDVSVDLGRVLEMQVAPAGDLRAALTNQRQELLLVDVKSGKRSRIDHSAYGRITGPAWSPDGRYLAYACPVTLQTVCIRVLDTRTGTVHDVTRPDFNDVAPAFDPEGKYLYFVSWRVFDPVYDTHYFDLGFQKGSRPHLVTLRKETTSPFSAAARPPLGPTGLPPGKEADAADKKKRQASPRVRIDFDGIQERVVAFPVPEGRYERVLGAKGRALFLSSPVEGSLDQPWPETGELPAKSKLESWDYQKQKKEVVAHHITSFDVSRDGGALALRVGNRLRVVAFPVKAADLPSSTAFGRESGWVNLGRLPVEVVPGDEWRQMFGEAWRLQRDQFWTPDMSGVDWKGVHRRYLPLVDRVAVRSEFSDLMWEMQGELGTSHCYEMGGDYRPTPQWHQGFLGADLEFDVRKGGWYVARIPRGDGWTVAAGSPLAAPGLQVKEGEVITAVGGQAVGKDRSPYVCLANHSGRAVTVTLRGRGKNAKSRTITVQTLR